MIIFLILNIHLIFAQETINSFLIDFNENTQNYYLFYDGNSEEIFSEVSSFAQNYSIPALRINEETTKKKISVIDSSSPTFIESPFSYLSLSEDDELTIYLNGSEEVNQLSFILDLINESNQDVSSFDSNLVYFDDSKIFAFESIPCSGLSKNIYQKDYFDEVNSDFCLGNYLYELECTPENELELVIYSCPNGCEDGRCSKPTVKSLFGILTNWGLGKVSTEDLFSSIKYWILP